MTLSFATPAISSPSLVFDSLHSPRAPIPTIRNREQRPIDYRDHSDRRFGGASNRFGGVSNDQGLGVAVDSGDDVVLTGFFDGTMDFGGGPLTSAGGFDIFVAKLEGDGSPVWSRRLGGTSLDQGLGVAVDSGDDVVLTGFFNGTVDFGDGPLTSAGLADIFVAKYSASEGSHLWSRRFGSTSTDQGLGVAVDSGGDVVVTGAFADTVDFGRRRLTSAGSDDIFLLRLRP
jgi:hypothetical protein